MKVVILAGGLGTRLAEETGVRPKPMVEIGGRPIVWHIMSMYAAHGFRDFVVACGYKGELIKEYFRNYSLHQSDLALGLRDGSCQVLSSPAPDWRVTLIDTGQHTATGGRIGRLRNVLRDEPFMVTYGDGVADLDIGALVKFHKSHGRLATVTAVRPPARFGGLVLDGNQVREFTEKSQADAGWINAGFFIFEPAVLEHLTDDGTILEHEPLEHLAAGGQLMAYLHEGFWQPMDTLRERNALEALWASGQAPWMSRERA